jgi:tetratricopeptide (TPR) repeat protein
LEQAGVDAPYDPESYAILAGIELNRADLSKAESLLEKAKELMSKGQLSDRRKPGLQRQIDFGFATLAEVRKDWPSAQKVWEEILKINPKDTIATTRLAHCLFRQKDVDGALKVLREAAKSNPKMVAPEALIAQIYQQDGDVENMDKWMDAAVKANPKNVATRIAAGYAALTQGRLDDVRAHAVAAAQIDPKSYDSVVLRGLVSVFQKDFMAAELFFETALQQLPNSFPISNNLALALAEQDGKGKKERALEIAETNIKKYPRSPNAASTYGWVLYRLGRVDDAEKALRNAVNGSISVDTAYYVARVMVDQGHKDEAIKILQSVSNDKTSLSMYRQEAKELLESLKKK